MAKKTAFLLHYDMLENLKLLGNDVTVEVLTALSLHDQGMDIMPLSPQAQFAVNSYLPALNKAKKRWETSIVNGGGTVGPDEPGNKPAEPNGNLAEPSGTLDEASGGLGGGVLVPDLVLAPVPEISCGSSKPPSPQKEPPETADPSPAETSANRGEGLNSKNKKPPLRERDPENAHETGEKAYRRNWDRLCAEGKVRTRDPVVNWAQARKLLSTHFAKGVAPEKIVEAINSGLKNDFVMRGGYSLTMMLSATVLNGLLNSTGPPKGSPHRIASDEIPGDEWRYFARDDLDESLGEG